MKEINYVLSILLSVISLNVSAESISKFSATKEPTTQWYYVPSNILLESSGIKNREYPIVTYPEPQYIISSPIAIANYESIGVSCSYHVATSSTHPLKVEIIDENDKVVFSHNFDGTPNVELAMGGYVDDITLQSEIVRFKFSLSTAYNETEIAYIDEVQVYGTLKEWSKRMVSVYSHEIISSGVEIKWASVTDAVSYKVLYAEKASGEEQVVSVEAVNTQKVVSTVLTGLKQGVDYQYQVKAYNSAGAEVASRLCEFNNSAGVNSVYCEDDKVYVSNRELVIDAHNASECKIYSMTGMLIKSLSLSEGENRVSLPVGIYILNQPRKSRLIVIH